jgi:hypothetical protein
MLFPTAYQYAGVTELNENLIFKQLTGMRIYCVPVRSVYHYASISLFMLLPTAYQYTGVPELNDNLIFKQRTTMPVYCIPVTSMQCLPVHQHITLHVILYSIPIRWSYQTQ